MKHYASAGFWKQYEFLPAEVRVRADRQFSLLKTNPQHPSLQLKKVVVRRGQELWSARVTLDYRALAIKRESGFLWFWIGDHRGYELLIS